MKRLSVKFKITLWYTLFIIVLSCAVLAAINSFGKDMIERDINTRIIRTVDDFAHRLSAPPDKNEPVGRPERREPAPYAPPENTEAAVSPDNGSGASRINGDPGGTDDREPRQNYYEQGVYIAVYNSSLELTAGQIPFELSSEPAFSDGELAKVSENGDKYYIYTKKEHRPGGEVYWVRGAVSVAGESLAVNAALRTNILLIIIMIIIASAGGYFIISRALAPVNKITRTAHEISKSSDLSRRIRIGPGNDEIHALANTFDHMLDRIEQTVEREKQFTSDASHELRTPAAVILSECEYMTDCAKTADEFRESAYSIKNQAERMSKLISELLMISRMDKNTMHAEFEELDISELLNFVCDEQEEIGRNDITLIREIPYGITAEADRFLLARLFINLISNAYSYGKSGGHITVSLSENGESITAGVADDGIGISEDDLPKIWERFYQADPSRTSNESGSMGLGLSMVKLIADCHNGKVEVESKPGKGSVFMFTMPKKTAHGA